MQKKDLKMDFDKYIKLEVGQQVIFKPQLAKELLPFSGTKGKIISFSGKRDYFGPYYGISWENIRMNKTFPGEFNWSNSIDLCKDERLKCRK
jgi:hypothetical protein